MMKLYFDISRSFPYGMLSRSFLVTLLSSVGLLCGVVPDLSANSPNMMFSSSAYAQAVSDEEVVRFARAAFTIEKRRQALVGEIKNRTGGNIPDITCDVPQQLEDLDINIRNDVKNFCDFSRVTIQANQLSVTRFFQINKSRNSDSALQQRIDRELLRIQSGS